MEVSKSYALDGIEKILDEEFPENDLYNRVLAEKILTFLEKDIGMLPPSIYLEVFNRYDNGWKDD